MVLDLYQQAVLGFLAGLCAIGYSILWIVLNIRKEARDALVSGDEQ